jgi:hypothetical protein
MIAEDIEKLKNLGFKVEELPTGYSFTVNKEAQSDIVLDKEPCEILQRLGKIEKIEVIYGKQLRIIILTPTIGSG